MGMTYYPPEGYSLFDFTEKRTFFRITKRPFPMDHNQINELLADTKRRQEDLEETLALLAAEIEQFQEDLVRISALSAENSRKISELEAQTPFVCEECLRAWIGIN